MDLTVLELGLRNRQLATVKCFCKIQIETFRLSLSDFGNQCLDEKAQSSQIECFFNDWEQVFSKLIIVISANITDANSRDFAICLARTALQSCNQLLTIVTEAEFGSDLSEIKSNFSRLFIKNIRLIRLSLKVQENDNKSKPIESIDSKTFNWDQNETEHQILFDSLRSNSLVLAQHWLKKERNSDMSWKHIVKNVILMSLDYLRIDDFDTFNVILCQLGIPVSKIVHKIYISTSDLELRQILVNKLTPQLLLLQDSNNQVMAQIIKIVNSSHRKSKTSLTISWINDMGDDLQQRAIILPLFLENGNLMCDNLSPIITWNYLIDRNDTKMLTLWVEKLINSDVTTFPFNWTINQDMVESVAQRASVLTKELVLNSLSKRGCFCSNELNDFQLILHRFGRTNSYDSSYSPEVLIDERLILPFSSFKMNVFSEKLIQYCIDHNLYEFLYIYSKHCSQTLSSVDNPLIGLLNASISCSQNPSDEQILTTILLTAQHIYSFATPVTIESLMDSGNVYLALISLTYSTCDFFDICNEDSDNLSNKSDTPKPSIANIFKTQYPILYDCLSESSNSCFQKELNCEPPTIYLLLKDSIPFDVSKMFCWQSLNNSECSEDYMTSMVFKELPHFSHTKLADLYGLKANLTFTYYLNQGRVVEAYNKFIMNRKVLNSKSIELACRRAALVAYNDTTNNHIAVSCVVFQQLLNGDSTQTLLHLAVANIVMSFAADFLSLNLRQQQIELSNLLKRSHYYSDKRAAGKLLQLTVAAISRKYKNFMNIQIEECFDWKIAFKFAELHGLEPPLDFLTKCAGSDNWLIFTICCQLHEYKKESVLNALKKFNNECISDHLSKAFQSSQLILAENDSETSSRILSKTNGRKITSAKHLRNVLYSKIGLSKTPELSDTGKQYKIPLKSTSLPIESDDMSIASETEYNAVETISVLSSSNASDTEDMPKFNEENAPKDLFQVILSCQIDSSYDARKSLMSSSIPLSNPILCLIACSFDYELEKFNIFSTFSCWLLASVDFEIRKQFSEIMTNFDPLNWSSDDNYKMLDLVTRDIKSYFIFLKGLKLFNLNISALIDLLNFMHNFFCEKNYYEVQSLKSFQDNLWKYEEPSNTDNLFFTKQWIQNASVIILTNALRNAKNYELVVLLRHYDFARIQGSFSPEIKVHDFRKLYRLCQCLSDTDVTLPIGQLLSDKIDINSFSPTNDHYCSIIKTVISNLQQRGYFQEARNFANSAEIESIDLSITEWTLRALANLNSIEFWDVCWESLIAVDTSLNSAFKVFNKFINQVSSAVVKCLLVFKCLIAAQNLENQTECAALETMLWKCVVDIEGSPRIRESCSSEWARIWSNIVIFMKSKRNVKSSISLDSVDSTIMNQQLSKSLDVVIGNLLNNGCIEKAHEVALLFGYNHQDLDIILACDNMAKGLIRNLSEAPLSVQLKTKAIGQLKKTTFGSEFTEEQKEKIGFIESISSLATIGKKACQRILLYFKISCVLRRSYSDIERPDLDDLELLKCLIAAYSHNNDALSFAKELILLNGIADEDVASIICKETLTGLRSSFSETSSRGSFSSNSSELVNASFLSLVRLLNDTTILGKKLLIESESEDVLREPVNYVLLTKLYIKAHECFSLACDVNGIVLVLRKSRLLITQTLLQLNDFNSILRLLTGIGRYSEMTYCFDILKENNQFELLLSKRIEKAPQLRIALLDYLKGDKEMYPLVALRFCLYREIAENHESSAQKLLNEMKLQSTSNLTSFREKLETIMFELIDAQESYCKAGCHTHADNCAKTAQLISLQIHYLPLNTIIINMKTSQVAQFIEQNTNFYEALIVADAYQHHTSWANAIFNNVILNNDWNYLSDYATTREISSSFVEELAQKFAQQIATKNWPNDKLSQMKKSMQRLIQCIEDYETRFKIAYKLNLVDVTSKMLSEESGAYLQDLRRSGFL